MVESYFQAAVDLAPEPRAPVGLDADRAGSLSVTPFPPLTVRTAPRRLAAALLLATGPASCGGEQAAPESYRLETTAEALRVDAPPYELGAGDTCRWLEDGRLFLETVGEYAGIQSVDRLWIEFQPPMAPRVEVASWNEELSSGARWVRSDIRGHAWVSSDGTGLAQPGGPDLTVEMDWTCWMSGSDQPGGGRIQVSAHDLALALGNACPPGAVDLAPSGRSLLQIEAQPLEPGDTARWLEDGRLFVEWTRKPRLFHETYRLWIDFESGRPARVRAALWQRSGKNGRPSTTTILEGRSWVSTEGDDSGAADVSDRIVELELTVGSLISPGHIEVAQSIPSATLARER